MGRGGAAPAPAKSSSFIFGPMRRRTFFSRSDPVAPLLPAMEPVESSNIGEVGFRLHRDTADTGSLFIRFNDRALFRWENVGRRVYLRMMAADSKGRFFQRSIKGLYPSTRLN